VDWGALGLLLARLAFSLYLLSSALSAFDIRPLARWEIAARIALAILILFKGALVFIPAVAIGVALVAFHIMRSSGREQPA
ncbi:MAG: hypothetical protein AAFN59_12915, partial [Pseudomonadota bacterium]